MNLGELVEHVRKHVLRDEALPPLWSDEELTLYFNEAQDLFARRTHILSDDESDLTFVTTEPGVAVYTLAPRVIFVSEVHHADTGIALRDMARRLLPRRFSEGRPVAYTMDARMRSMRLSPTPDAAYELDLLVARKALNRLVNEGDEPEIPEEHHLDLCDWVTYKALLNNDPEQTNTVSAEVFRNAWELKLRDAKRAVFRMRAGPNPHARGNWTGKKR